jgi:hypothetical protein
VRQALAGLARDGLVVSAYTRGYHVLGPRIPWLTRLRLLAHEPYDVEMIDVHETPLRNRLPHRLVTTQHLLRTAIRRLRGHRPP